MTRACGTELYDAFLAVVDSGSFTAAAERLHCSQTTVSQRIRRFEEVLERRLFRRSTRVVELTPAGEAFLPYARNLLRLHREGMAVVADAASEGLRFGVPDRYANAVMPVLMETGKCETGVAPLVQCNRSPVLYEALQQGQIDAALITRCASAEGGRFVASERMAWAGHPEFQHPATEPLPLALAPEDCPYRNLALRALEKANRAWNVVHTGVNGWALEEAVQLRRAVMAIPERRIGEGLVDVGGSLDLPEMGHAELELHLSAFTVERYGSEFEEVLIHQISHALAAH